MEVIPMKKQSIQIYADPELKHRIEEAAAKHNVPVAEYCLEAVEQKLAEDAALEGVNNKAAATPVTQKDALMDEIHELRERILARRGGKPIEIDVLELVRSERDDELTGMR